MKKLKVLVACEESQRVCTEFRKLGHEAYSTDIQEPSGGFPEWHILGDVLKVLNGGRFETMDGAEHCVDKWDLIIAHPYSKRTCLWLKGLPKLKPTDILTQYKPYVPCGTSRNKGNKDKAGVSRSGGAAKIRSKTFPGIATAMVKQWSEYIIQECEQP